MDVGTNLSSSSAGISHSAGVEEDVESQTQDDQNHTSHSGRKRIRVACDKCRRKKIKCDGNYPCSNCLQSRESKCHYTERPPKKKLKPPPKVKPPKKLSKKELTVKTLDMIDSRLSTLENAIFHLTEKIDYIVGADDHKTGRSQYHDYMESQDGSASEFTSESDNEEDHDDESNKSETDECEVIVGMVKQEITNTEIIGSTKRKDYVNFGAYSSFVGSHSILGIFGTESLNYIETILGPSSSDVITPLRNLPFILWTKTTTFLKKWVEPRVIDKPTRKRLIGTPFPSDSRIAFELISTYYPLVVTARTLVSQERAVKMFTEYYHSLTETNPKKKRRFTISELFLMSTVLLMSISCKNDMDSLSYVNKEEYEKPPALSEMSDSALLEFQNALLQNCIYYYYTVSVVSEGLETIEAILLLVIYIEINWLESTVNYIPISTAVRFAQYMGLHRNESYEADPEDEQRRKCIWWYCYYYDIETAFKTGKPPVVNSCDVNINIEDELLREFPDCLPADYIPLQNSNTIDMLYAKKPMLIGQYVMLGLTKVREKSYTKLFSAVGQKQDFDTLATTIEELNEEMYNVMTLFHEQDRPRFYNDPQFHFFSPTMPIAQKEAFARVLVTYFIHLSLMNRVPLLLQSPTVDFNDVRLAKFRTISLDAARTVLVLIKQLKVENTTVTYFSSVLYFPLAAFTILAASVLNHPTLPEAVNDINLLIGFSMDFFKISFKISESGLESLCTKKDLVVGFAIVLLLQIVIRHFEMQTGSNIYSTNEQLQEHFKSVYSIFPDLYKTKQEFRTKLFSLFGSSPFGTVFSKAFPSSASSTVSTTSQTYNQNQSPIYNPPTVTSQQHVPGTCDSNPGLENPSINYPNIQPPGSKFLATDSNVDEVYDAFTDYFTNDRVQNMYLNQMNNLPNFFFDNNLGM